MGKGSTPRPFSNPSEFAERWAQTFGARRELTALLLCPVCHGEGRDPDHHKNACPECKGTGRRKDAA
jgi:DnaJ-class molecular chaperone